MAALLALSRHPPESPWPPGLPRTARRAPGGSRVASRTARATPMWTTARRARSPSSAPSATALGDDPRAKRAPPAISWKTATGRLVTGAARPTRRDSVTSCSRNSRQTVRKLGTSATLTGQLVATLPTRRPPRSARAAEDRAAGRFRKTRSRCLWRANEERVRAGGQVVRAAG